MIAIIDYRAGNLTSVERAVRFLGHEVEITSDHSKIRGADHIIFPGVGAAGKAMRDIQELGLDLLLKDAFAQGRPILGICLGTQIIFDYSEENDTLCLGLIPGRVKAFPDPLHEDGKRLKIPHMGWNRLTIEAEHPVFSGVLPDHEFYFVHGFYPKVEMEAEQYVVGTTHYGITFASAVARESLVAVQFHPEKSGRAGLMVLNNFCRWRPC